MAGKESDNLLQAIAETTPDLVYVYDLQEDRNVYANAFIGDMLGFTVEQVQELGSAFIPSLIHPDDHQAVIEWNTQMAASETDEVRELEYRIRHADGTYRWFVGRNRPFLRDQNGSVKQIIGSVRDVTEMKEADARVQEALTRAEELNQRKDRLMSIIAHDLRGAYSGLLGLTGILRGEDGSLSDKDRRSYTELLHQGMEASWQLLSNLLMWAQVQLGAIEPDSEPVKLSEICERVGRTAAANAAENNITIVQHHRDAEVTCTDADLVEVIIRNYLQNAIKFSPEESEIRVESTREGEYATVSVVDEGMGIDPAKTAQLFSLSRDKVQRDLRGAYGSGLGLALCRELADTIGATVSASKNEGAGSTFTLHLHAAKGCLDEVPLSETQ
jgi:PAS domain S-box-containing protein